MNNLANNELTNYSVWPLSFPFSILIMVKSELIEFFFFDISKMQVNFVCHSATQNSNIPEWQGFNLKVAHLIF